MADESKNKAELDDELALLRQRVAELESAKATQDGMAAQLTAMTEGLRAVAAAADELMGCADLDTLFRRGVELAREQLWKPARTTIAVCSRMRRYRSGRRTSPKSRSMWIA